MTEEILFKITKDQLETGMRGFPVGYCTTSTVDPQKGLFYAGKPIPEVAAWRPENVIYLLMSGKAGASGTMLTGPGGIDPNALQLGKSTLLGG